MSKKELMLLGVGDMIVDTTQPDAPFELVAPLFRSAAAVVGQGELPFTSRGVNTFPDLNYSSLPCNPDNIKALVNAGFDVITTASNHTWDSGAPGVEDTIAGLKAAGLASCGAGMNLEEARQPAVIEREGTKFGFLAYNCSGPRGSWATKKKPGCAYVDACVSYEEGTPTIGGIPIVRTFAEPESLKAMEEDIRKLRPQCDVLVISFHKGLGYIPARLADFEQQISYAAIDAGADVIFSHHAHILKGVETYKGKAIFHGLGNFVTVCEVDHENYFRYGSFIKMGKGHPKSKSESAEDQKKHTQELLRNHGGPFVFEAGGKPCAFPPREINMTMIAKCMIEDGKIVKAGYLPCLINEHGQPEILKHDDERGQQVYEYIENISNAIDLNVEFAWEGDDVIVTDPTLK